MASGQRCRETALPRSSSSAKRSRAEGTACRHQGRCVRPAELKGSLWWENTESSLGEILTAFATVSGCRAMNLRLLEGSPEAGTTHSLRDLQVQLSQFL